MSIWRLRFKTVGMLAIGIIVIFSILKISDDGHTALAQSLFGSSSTFDPTVDPDLSPSFDPVFDPVKLGTDSGISPLSSPLQPQPFASASALLTPPCPAGIGEPHPDLGSGNCRGNYDAMVLLQTAGFGLHYNSMASTADDFGFGPRWSPGFNMVYDAVQKVLIHSDGTRVKFIDSPAGGNRLVPQDDRQGQMVIQAETVGESLRIYFSDGSYWRMMRATGGSYSGYYLLYEQVSPAGNRLAFFREFGTYGRVTNIVRAPISSQVQISYTATSVTVTDPAGSVYTLQKDSSKGVQSITYPDTMKATFAYSGPDSRLTEIKSRNGKLEKITYYTNGAVKFIEHPDGMTSLFEYIGGNTVRLTDSGGNILEEVLDVSVASDPKIITSTLNGEKTVYTREATGLRRISQIQPWASSAATISYNDSVSTTVRQTIMGGVTKTSSFTFNTAHPANSLRRPSTVTTVYSGANTVTNNFVYDGFDVTTVGVNGKNTVFQYTRGLLKKMTSWTGEVMFEASNGSGGDYDASGNLLGFKDRFGRLTTYSYDGNGFVKKIVGPNQDYISYTNDVLGRTVRIDTWNGYSTNSYDAMGAILSSVVNRDGMNRSTVRSIQRYVDGSIQQVRDVTTLNGTQIQDTVAQYEGGSKNSMTKLEIVNTDGVKATLYDVNNRKTTNIQVPEIPESFGN